MNARSKRATESLAGQILIGVLLGLLILPPQPAQAQFAVFDPTAYALQIQKRVEEINRWVQQVQQYTQMYQRAVEQLTTMRGVLSLVDKQLGRDLQLAVFVSSVGKIIRGSLKLRRDLEAMLTYRIAYIKNIDDRLRAGIFNPSADVQDLENYLKYSIGRHPQDTVARMEKLTSRDTELAGWLARRQEIESQLSAEYKTLIEAQTKAQNENLQPPGAQVQVSTINDVVLATTNLINALESERAELTSKIDGRVKQYGARVQEMENFAFSVISLNEGWTSFKEVKDSVEQTLYDIISGNPKGANP